MGKEEISSYQSFLCSIFFFDVFGHDHSMRHNISPKTDLRHRIDRSRSLGGEAVGWVVSSETGTPSP